MSRDQVKVDFGKEVFEIRNSIAKKGEPASQVAMGKMVGVTGTTISSWEHGYLFPTRENFEVLVKRFPTLDKEEYRNAILMDWVYSSGPHNPNPSHAPRTGTGTVPNRVVRMAKSTDKKWDTPSSFKDRVQTGDFKTRAAARGVLTKTWNRNISNSWLPDDYQKTLAFIDAYFLGKQTRSSAAEVVYDPRTVENFRFKLAGGTYRNEASALRAVLRLGDHLPVEERLKLQAEVRSYFSTPDEPAVQLPLLLDGAPEARPSKADKVEEPSVQPPPPAQAPPSQAAPAQAQAPQPPPPPVTVQAAPTPPRTELIPFHSFTIEAFKDPTGEGYWAQLSTICDPIGVDTKTQRIKLQGYSWAKGKVRQFLTLHSDGSQRTGSPPWYIHSSIIAMWLATMHENNVPAGPIRESLIKLQLQLCEVLDRYFHMKHVATTEDILVSALTACTKWMSTVHIRLANLEGLVRKLVEPPVKASDQTLMTTPAQAATDGWITNGLGAWTYRDGTSCLEEQTFLNHLDGTPGIRTACEDFGVRLDAGLLQEIASLVKVAPKLIVLDGVEMMRLWPDPDRQREPFSRVLRAVLGWLGCGAPPFVRNGSGQLEMDTQVAFSNLSKKHGAERAAELLAHSLRAYRQLMSEL